ncbi:hypothetical protein RFI_20401, partial [Reticulomyxa filosa]
MSTTAMQPSTSSFNRMNKEDLKKLAARSGAPINGSHIQTLERIRDKLDRRVQLFDYLKSNVTDEYDFFAHFLSQCYAIENLMFLAHALIFRSIVLDLHSELSSNRKFKTFDTFYPLGRKDIFHLDFAYLTEIKKGYQDYIEANSSEAVGKDNGHRQWVDLKP